MKVRLRGPVGFILLVLPLALLATVLRPELLQEENIGSASVLIRLFFLARYILGLRYPLSAFLILVLACTFLWPLEVYGESDAVVVGVWLGRFGLSLAALFGIPYIVIRPHELLQAAFPKHPTPEKSLRLTVLVQATLLLLLTTLTVVVERSLTPESGSESGALFGMLSFSILTWIPLISFVVPTLLALLTFGLERGHVWSALALPPSMAIFDLLSFKYGVLLVLFFVTIGVAGAILSLRPADDIKTTVLASLWSSGTAANLWALYHHQPQTLACLVIAQVVTIALLRRYYESPTATLPLLGAMVRAISPLHWILDLNRSLLEKLDGPGPVWD